MSLKNNSIKGMQLSKVACALIAGLAIQGQAAAATFVDENFDIYGLDRKAELEYFAGNAYVSPDVGEVYEGNNIKGGDADRLIRTDLNAAVSDEDTTPLRDVEAALIYNVEAITDFSVKAFHTPQGVGNGQVATITVSGSTDGETFTPIATNSIADGFVISRRFIVDNNGTPDDNSDDITTGYEEVDNINDVPGWQLNVETGLRAWQASEIVYSPTTALDGTYNYLKVAITGGAAAWQDEIGSVSITGDNLIRPTVPTESVTLSSGAAVTLAVDATSQITYDVTPTNGNTAMTWVSDTEAVATVSETGLITALTTGSATITGTATNPFAGTDDDPHTVDPVTIVVTVEDADPDPVALTDINLTSAADVTLAVDETTTIAYEFVPVNATNQNITWTISDDTVASFDASTGVVTADGVGQTTITGTSEEDSSITISVTITVEADDVTPVYPTSIQIADAPETLYVGNSETLSVTTDPSVVDGSLEYATSDDNVADVSDGGEITAKGAGTADITVYALDTNGDRLDGIMHSISVTVMEQPGDGGDQQEPIQDDFQLKISGGSTGLGMLVMAMVAGFRRKWLG